MKSWLTGMSWLSYNEHHVHPYTGKALQVGGPGIQLKYVLKKQSLHTLGRMLQRHQGPCDTCCLTAPFKVQLMLNISSRVRV